MSDESLNGAIDEVARQMTAGAAAGSAGFRRRIVERIEAGETPRRAWRAAFVLTPIAAAIAIVIALIVVRRPDPGGSGVTRPAPMVAAAPAAAAAALQPPAAAAAVDLAAPTQPRERTALQLTASGMTAPEPVLAVDSIDVAPLTVDALTHDPMPIERLETIAPMTVAPLDITDLQKEDR